MSLVKTNLIIRNVELHVHLGWLSNERIEAQVVSIDIELHFPLPPKACVSDNLDDAVCYALLLEKIREVIPHKEFHLIEHLAYDIYSLIKKHVPENTHVRIHLSKHPKIEGLMGHVCFSYGDGN